MEFWKKFKPSEITEGIQIFVGFEVSQNGCDFTQKRYFDTIENEYVFLDTNLEYIRHQCGGEICNQKYLIGKFLEPKSVDVYTNLVTMTNVFNVPILTSPLCFNLDFYVKYQKFLKKNLKIDCDNSFITLEEAFYPIDINYIDKISKLPKEFKKHFDAYGTIYSDVWMQPKSVYVCTFELKLWILSENSD